jgi:purine nucleoside permease
VDYDLGHRWSSDEVKPREPLFMPRKGYESIRVYRLNPSLVDWAMRLSVDTPLKGSEAANAYRMRYPQDAARRAPFVATGTHMTGDTFFHGPGMSAQAQYIAKLYGADDYVITEMEGTGKTQVIGRQYGTDRVMTLRGAVNFEQENLNVECDMVAGDRVWRAVISGAIVAGDWDNVVRVPDLGRVRRGTDQPGS